MTHVYNYNCMYDGRRCWSNYFNFRVVRTRLAFRSLDLRVTAVTSSLADGTGASDAEGHAASVVSMGAPSHLGPRKRPALCVCGATA